MTSNGFGYFRTFGWICITLAAAACSGAVERSEDVPDARDASADASADAASACGSALAELTPRSSSDGRYVMHVYEASAGDASVSGSSWERRTVPGGGCSVDGRLTKTSETVSLEPGIYDVCREGGGCQCMRVRLLGGPAEVYWEVGPANRYFVRGCAESRE